MIFYTILIAIIIIIIFFIIFSTLFNKNYIERILKINSAINEIENENYNINIMIKGKDELTNIAKRINQMSSIIGKKMETLHGLIPICANCKKVRDDKGYWQQVETYISNKSEADFSHTFCPDCYKKLYPDLYKEDQNK